MSLSTSMVLIPSSFQLSVICALACSTALLMMCEKKAKSNAPPLAKVVAKVKPADASKYALKTAKPRSEKKEEPKKADEKKGKSKMSEKPAAPNSKSTKGVKKASEKKEKSKEEAKKKDDDKKEVDKKEDKKKTSAKKNNKRKKSKEKASKKSEIGDLKEEGSQKEAKDAGKLHDADKRSDEKDDKEADDNEADDNEADDNEADDKKADCKKTDDKKTDDKKTDDKKTDDKKTDDKKTDDKKEANKKEAKKEVSKEDGSTENGSKKDDSKKESSKINVEKKEGDDKLKEGSEMDVRKTLVTAIPTPLPKELSIEPKELRFTSDGGQVKLNLTNNTGARIAIKIKCSDNNLYRVNPVFALIEKEANFTVEVSRATGTAKPDKLAIVHTEVADVAKDAQAVFKAAPTADKLVVIAVPIFVF